MDIVDSQVHIGPGGAEKLVAAMDALGVSSIFVDETWIGTPGYPIYQVGEGVRASSPTAELAAWTYPGRFSYLVRIDWRDPDLRNVIRMARDATHARALRIIPGWDRAGMKDYVDGKFDDVFAYAAEYDMPMFVQIAGYTDLLAPYLEKYPDLKIIIDHCGMPPGRLLWPVAAEYEGLPDSAAYWKAFSEQPLNESFAKVLKMADWPNVALKWGHAPNMFDCPGYPNEGLRPFLRQAVNAFGAERIMFASDVSMNQTGETWAELIFGIRNNPDLSQSEIEYILGGAARKWLNWEAP